MKHLFPFILILFAVLTSFAQRIDSVRYERGYLYFKEYGKGEPLVILAGGPGLSADNHEEVAKALASSYRCILLDQRGTGRSVPDTISASTINLQASLTDLSRLLDHLQLKSAHFYGYSWGATMALTYATSYPDRIKSLVLVGPGIICHNTQTLRLIEDNLTLRLGLAERSRRDSLTALAVQKGMTPEVYRELLRLNILSNIYDKSKLNGILDQVTKSDFKASVQNLMLYDLARNGFDLTDKLPRLSHKVSIITGRQDPLHFLTYDIQHLVPRARVLWLDKCGHFPMFEQPRIFYMALERALKDSI